MKQFQVEQYVNEVVETLNEWAVKLLHHSEPGSVPVKWLDEANDEAVAALVLATPEDPDLEHLIYFILAKVALIDRRGEWREQVQKYARQASRCAQVAQDWVLVSRIAVLRKDCLRVGITPPKMPRLR